MEPLYENSLPQASPAGGEPPSYKMMVPESESVMVPESESENKEAAKDEGFQLGQGASYACHNGPNVFMNYVSFG